MNYIKKITYPLRGFILSISIALLIFSYIKYKTKTVIVFDKKLNLQELKKTDIIFGDINLLHLSKQILLVRFSPDCDFCQHDAKAIVSSQAKNISIIFSSSGNREDIIYFINKFGLFKLAKGIVIRDSANIIANSYNCNVTPSYFLFNNELELEKKCCGSLKLSLLSNEFKEEKK